MKHQMFTNRNPVQNPIQARKERWVRIPNWQSQDKSLTLIRISLVLVSWDQEHSKVPNQDDVINSPIIMSVTLPSLARLSARNEHVLEVLVCQSGHLHPPGLGWSPSHSGGWYKLAPSGPVQIQPVCIIETLSSLIA